MDTDSDLFGRIVLVIALILLRAFFTMSETSITTFNDARLQKMAAQGHKKAALIARLVSHPSRFLATVKVGSALSGFFAFFVVRHELSRLIGRALWRFTPVYDVVRAIVLEDGAIVLTRYIAWLSAATFVVSGLIAALLIIAFGDMIPKHIAARHHEKIAMALAGPFAFFTWLLRPFVAILSFLSGGVLRLMGIDPNKSEETVTEEEIRMLLDEGSEEGNIEQSDKDMINNIFDFGDTRVKELMIHRTDMVAIEKNSDLQEIVDVIVESGYTRIPVYEGDLDNIVGILYVKDLLGLITRSPGGSFDISKYLLEPFYAIDSMRCKLLFTMLKEKKMQMAVVVDEYGGTAGIITMEDLLEGIVGDIKDEYDQDEEDDISHIESGAYIMDGIADLEDVCETLGLEPDEEDLEEFETIGGYIVHKLGYIPEEDEQPSIAVGNVLFTVQAMEDRRIAKLKAERQEPNVSDQDAGQPESAS